MSWRPGDRFVRGVACAAVLGFVIRVVYVVLYRHHQVIGDALVYHLEGQALHDGHGFQRAFEAVPTAEHPPMQVVLVAFADVFGDTSFAGQEMFMACIGTCTVVAVAFLGRAAGGPRVGLIAGFLAAVYPMLWVVDGTLLSETPYLLIVTLILLAAYGFRASPTWRRAAGLGALIALGTLTRGEAISLLVLLVAPLAWRSLPPWRPRLLAFAAAVLAFCVVMSPWTIRNVLTFKNPTAVLIADDGSGVLTGANCHSTYYTTLIGSWDYGCFDPVPQTGDESQKSEVYRHRGLHFARTHLGRVPLVVLARLGRQLDVFRFGQSVFFQSSEGRDPDVVRWGIRFYWIVLALGIAGLVILRRRRETVLILGATLAMVLLLGMAVYGSTRLRVAAEPVLVVLAAVTLDAALARVQARRSAGAPKAEPAPA